MLRSVLVLLVHSYVVKMFRLIRRPGVNRNRNEDDISSIRRDVMFSFVMFNCTSGGDAVALLARQRTCDS